jgi:hypothetical protein
VSRSAKRAIALSSALLLAGGLAWVFVSAIGGPGRTEAAAVILSAPPEFEVTPAGDLDAAAAAGSLASLAAQPAAKRKVGLSYNGTDGSRVILLLDRDADLLDERAAGTAGTRTQTVWRGRALDRLAAARTTGSLDLPGLPPGEKKNLYH